MAAATLNLPWQTFAQNPSNFLLQMAAGKSSGLKHVVVTANLKVPKRSQDKHLREVIYGKSIHNFSLNLMKTYLSRGPRVYSLARVTNSSSLITISWWSVLCLWGIANHWLTVIMFILFNVVTKSVFFVLFNYNKV